MEYYNVEYHEMDLFGKTKKTLETYKKEIYKYNILLKSNQ